MEIKKKKESIIQDYSVSVAARVIYQLGEQLISDEFIALAELIKNGYDADCTNVTIEVDTKINTPHGRGKIVIRDNGNGMSKSILTDSFLRISSDFKKVNRYSPFYNRRALGEKGLGRLSIQRLGHYLELRTSPRLERLKDYLTNEDNQVYKNFNTHYLSINWEDFKYEAGDLNLVKAKVYDRSIENPRFGTELIIEGIRNLDFWNLDTKTKTRIRTEIYGMTNLFEQKVSKKFKIYISIDNEPFTNEKIDEEILNLMSDVILSFKLEKLKLTIDIVERKKYKERLRNKTILNMRQSGFEDYNLIEEYEDSRSNLIIDLNENNCFDNFPYLKDLKLQKVFEKYKNDYIIAEPGNFEGVIYVSEQSGDAITEGLSALLKNDKDIKTQKELKAIWKAAMGVYLFRNDFRIFPYGQPTFDWLNFTERSQKEKNNIYKMHTVSGYIDIESISSENLMEQTNRQGLIEDEYGNNFLTIVRDIITQIAFRMDVGLRESTNINNRELKDNEKFEIYTVDKKVLFYRSNETEESALNMEKMSGAIEKINSNPSVDKQIKRDLEKYMNQIIKVDKSNKQKYKQEFKVYEQQIIDLKSLAGLAGQGIIIESLTHELHRIESNIKDYTKDSILKIKKLGLEQNIKESLLNNQDRILHEIIYLQQQLEHLEPTYSKNKLLLQNIDLNKFLESMYIEDGPMSKKALAMDIKVIISGENFSVNANKGVLITIFDNLFLNSLYWIKQNTNNLEVHFNISKEDSCIYIWDSGPGFHSNIENIAFEPYKSMKKEGRGLGLYIISELLKLLNGSINLVQNKTNQYGNKYILKINFQ